MPWNWDLFQLRRLPVCRGGCSEQCRGLRSPCAFCSVDLLSKFSPSPSPGSAAAAASFAGALVERMAGRVLVFFVRHASLLRPLSQAGKVQLAKV